MRGFIIQHLKGDFQIQEIEYEKVLPMEDPSVVWSLKEGEFRFKVLTPTSLYDRDKFLTDEKGKPSLTPPVYHSHALYPSLGYAEVWAQQFIRKEFERALMKHGAKYSEEDVQKKIKEIKISRL